MLASAHALFSMLANQTDIFTGQHHSNIDHYHKGVTDNKHTTMLITAKLEMIDTKTTNRVFILATHQNNTNNNILSNDIAINELPLKERFQNQQI